MKTAVLKNMEQALELAKEGEVTLQDNDGERYTLKHKKPVQPVNVELLRRLRVKMPGITSDELVESVHEMRAAGYN